MTPLIIAIDGPSGAGKSTLGRRLARELGLLYVDTGAMYRAAALAVVEGGRKRDGRGGGGARRRAGAHRTRGRPDSLRVMLEGRDVSARFARADHAPLFRHLRDPGGARDLVRRQREMGERGGGVVLDGRDIGTVVFPVGGCEIFLTAVPEERAKRRFDEDHAKEPDLTFQETLADINTRDERDSTRADSPLRIAEDAVVIDTTELSVEEVFARMLEVVRERRGFFNCAT
jgi:cytidylate kinase